MARIAALSPAAFGARRDSSPCLAQVAFDKVDKRQVGGVADALEGDEPLEQRLGLGEAAFAASSEPLRKHAARGAEHNHGDGGRRDRRR